MPRYTNSNTSVVSIGGLRLEPGETKDTLEYIPGTLPAGVTEDAAAPTFKPVILSQKVTSGTTVTIPETFADSLTGVAYNLVGNYLITVYVGVGECTVQLNGLGTVRYVGLYETYTIRCLSRVIDTLVLTVTGTTYVTVEAI